MLGRQNLLVHSMGGSIPWKLVLLYLLICSMIPSPRSAFAHNASCPGKLPVLGVYEKARLDNLNRLEVNALIDSGATTTALDARSIKMYINRKGQRWVHYTFRHKTTGRSVAMHQPVSRVARIITHSGSPKERAVVRNTVSIGHLTKHIEMSLINRSNFPQQLLIGRNFLNNVALIDSGKSYLQGSAK